MSDKSSQPSIPGSPLSGIEAVLLSPNTVGNLPITVGGASSKGPEGLSKKKRNVYERLGVNHIYNMVDEKSLQAKQEVVIIEGNLGNRNRSITTYSAEITDESIPPSYYYSVEELFNLIQSDISNKFDQNVHLVSDIYPLHILNIRNIILRSSNTKDNNVYDHTIIFQRYVVLLSVEDINVIITAHKLYFLLPPKFPTDLLVKMRNKIINDSNYLPFEYCVYDSVLHLLQVKVKKEVEEVQQGVEAISDKFDAMKSSTIILSGNFEDELMVIRKKTTKLQSRITKYTNLVNKLLLEDEESMKLMSLSSYCGSAKLESFDDIDCQLITILFNEYMVYFTTYYNRIENKITHLDNKVSSMKLRLDNSRNELYLLNTYFTLLFVFLSFAGFNANLVGNATDYDISIVAMTYFLIAIIGSILSFLLLRTSGTIPRIVDFKTKVVCNNPASQ